MSVQASLNGLVSSVLGTANQIDTVTEKEVEKEFKDSVETEEKVEELKEDFDEADKAAMKSQQKKITTQTNQATALEERINLLRAISEKGMTKAGVNE